MGPSFQGNPKAAVTGIAAVIAAIASAPVTSAIIIGSVAAAAYGVYAYNKNKEKGQDE